GSGLKKYLSIILPIIVNKFSTILADEMENGLDKESIRNLLKNILKLSRNNDTQIFFTIENLEILKLLSEIVNEEFNDIKETVNIINIVNTGNDGFKSYNYNTDNLNELIESI
ncbi:ATPase, partial [Brachyspira innocens]|nr:ATPase [Brachyspira innocens]